MVLMRLKAFAALSGFVSALLVGGVACAQDNKPSRVVAIGGSVTEIVYALGEGSRLVGRDSTSVFPPEALKLPDTGYIRALSAEGVLSLGPDLILALDGAGPPEALEALKSGGVPVVTIPEGYDAGAIARKVEAVGKALQVEDKARALEARVETALSAAIRDATVDGKKTRVLFVLSLQDGRIMAAGNNSHANGIIELAGGENVMSSISGYKQISNEAVIMAAPDVILMMNPTGDHSPADNAVLAHSAIAQTPAGKHARLVRMDGMYLLGFGPRTADAVASLHAKLYPGNTGGN
jgi:iron complex transport system substrate-binding protein